jgi:hypothetical protein
MLRLTGPSRGAEAERRTPLKWAGLVPAAAAAAAGPHVRAPGLYFSSYSSSHLAGSSLPCKSEHCKGNVDMQLEHCKGNVDMQLEHCKGNVDMQLELSRPGGRPGEPATGGPRATLRFLSYNSVAPSRATSEKGRLFTGYGKGPGVREGQGRERAAGRVRLEQDPRRCALTRPVTPRRPPGAAL